MESRFGVDLGTLRLYADERAADAARRLDARAFTLGRNIFFGRGEPRPGSQAGELLLMHEIAHAIQQDFATSLPEAPRVSVASSPDEQAADAAVRSIEAGARPRLAAAPVQIARQPKGSTPAEEVEQTPPEDKWKGTFVSSIVISVARGKCGFMTSGGMLIGKADTNLPVGTYELSPAPAQHGWNISGKGLEAGIPGKGLEAGIRFNIDLTPANADPWTLRYPAKLPLTVSAGSLADPADVAVFLAQGGEVDPLWAFEGAKPAPSAPVAGPDDFETIDIETGSPPKYRVQYRDGTEKRLVYAELTPKMRKHLQRYFTNGEEDATLFIEETFWMWWSIVGTPPLFQGLPQVMAHRPYIPGRVPLAKTAQRPLVRFPLQPPAAGRPVEPATRAPSNEQAGAPPQGAMVTAGTGETVIVAFEVHRPQGPGARFGQEASARLNARGLTGPSILRPLSAELNAQTNMTPMDKAIAVQVACNQQPNFGAGPIARMPSTGDLVVTPSGQGPNAHVVIVRSNGTVVRGVADVVQLKTDTDYFYKVSNVRTD